MGTTNRDSAGLPFARLDTKQIPRDSQFDAWRDSIAPLFDSRPLLGEKVSDYRTDVSAYLVDSLMVSQISFTRQHFVRDRRFMANGETDHFMLQLYTEGVCACNNGGRDFAFSPQVICLIDLGRSIQSTADASSSLGIVIPRDVMREYAGGLNGLHGRTLATNTPQGRILVEHLRTLWSVLPTAQAGDAASLAATTSALVGALFQSSSSQPADDAPGLGKATLDVLCRYIEAHLDSPELGVTALCREFHLSRSKVYRLFKPLGGVEAFIRDRRLLRCYHELRSAQRGERRITDIATAWGFSSPSHFTRLFRSAFGVSPSEILDLRETREADRTGSGAEDFMAESQRVAQWLSAL